MLAQHRTAPVALAVALLAAVAVASCSEPVDLVVVNRSDAAIAFAPDLIVAPCSTAGYTRAQLEAGMRVRLELLDDEWLSEGAVPFGEQIGGRPIGSMKPLTMIISGSDDIRLVDGPVALDALPSCGGAPVGI